MEMTLCVCVLCVRCVSHETYLRMSETVLECSSVYVPKRRSEIHEVTPVTGSQLVQGHKMYIYIIYF